MTRVRVFGVPNGLRRLGPLEIRRTTPAALLPTKPIPTDIL